MNIFEKLKKTYLNSALDDFFYIGGIITAIVGKFNLDFNKEKKKNKTLEFIKYLLDSKLFTMEECTVDNLSFKQSDSINDILLKINYLWDNAQDDSWKWVISFVLTPQGTIEAKKDLLNACKSKENMLIKGHKKSQSLMSIFDIVKEELKTNDFDEILIETINSIDFLIGSKYIEVGDGKPWFTQRNLNQPDSLKRIEIELKTLNNESNYNGNTFFQNTPATNALVEKWKECGGRLVNDWYYYIDNK